MAGAAEHAALRAEIEAFLYEEAELLDNWQLMEWAALFTEDAIYQAPALDDPTRDPATASSSSMTICRASSRGRASFSATRPGPKIRVR